MTPTPSVTPHVAGPTPTATATGALPGTGAPVQPDSPMGAAAMVILGLGCLALGAAQRSRARRV